MRGARVKPLSHKPKRISAEDRRGPRAGALRRTSADSRSDGRIRRQPRGLDLGRTEGRPRLLAGNPHFGFEVAPAAPQRDQASAGARDLAKSPPLLAVELDVARAEGP